MSPLQVDRLNLGLILLSAAVAWWMPFGTFLFAYAVLGPLHYFTEVQWLHRKGYFVRQSRGWPWILVGIAVLLSIVPLTGLIGDTAILSQSRIFRHPEFWVLWAVWFAVGLVLFESSQRRFIWAAVGALILSVLIGWFPQAAIRLKVLIPTVVHVYLFTLLFMVWGWRKSRSSAGTMGLVLMVIVPVVLMLLPAGSSWSEAEQFYHSTDLRQTNFTLAEILGVQSIVEAEVARKIQVLLAFAYTYHYLNWFSKTSLIGWGKTLSKRSAWIIGILWATSVGIYCWNYEVGLVVLFLASFAHVLLELPLNVQTVKALVKSG